MSFNPSSNHHQHLPAGATPTPRATRRQHRQGSYAGGAEGEEADVSLISHVNKKAGEDNFTIEAYYPSNLPLHAFVELKTKQDIWAHKYVDFSVLLPRDERPKNLDKWIIQITNDSIDTKTTNDNLITNFTLWDKAYHIFLSIHSANPMENNSRLISDLLSYRDSARTIEKLRQFRQV